LPDHAPERNCALTGQTIHKADRCATFDAIDENISQFTDFEIGQCVQMSDRESTIGHYFSLTGGL
jgi:hypothetical protein